MTLFWILFRLWLGDVVSSRSLPLEMDAFHFDEIIKVVKVDADGKKYEKGNTSFIYSAFHWYYMQCF